MKEEKILKAKYTALLLELSFLQVKIIYSINHSLERLILPVLYKENKLCNLGIE